MSFNQQPNQLFTQTFLRAAQALGYNEQNLKPVNIENIANQHEFLTKKMTQKQRQFYLHKKFTIAQAKREKIIKQININIKLQKHKPRPLQIINPRVQQIFQEHKNKIKRSQRYNQTLSRGLQTSDSNHRNRVISQTINLGRASPTLSNRSSYSKTSQSSRKSFKSDYSKKSNRSQKSEVQMTKSKLQQTRLKEKQVQEYKKKMLQQKLKQDQLKFLRASQNLLTKTRKVKTRSQISQKIVKQNKQELELIKNWGMKNHLESLKYKINKQQFKRQNMSKNSNMIKKDDQIMLAKIVKEQIENSKNIRNKIRYQQKLNISQQWKDHYDSLKRQSLSYNKQVNQAKAQLAFQKKIFHQKEQNKIRGHILLYEKIKLEQAHKRRMEQKEKNKLQSISLKIKKQQTQKNKKVLQTSHSNRVKANINNFQQKIKQIEQLQELKNTLKHDHQKFNKYLKLKNKQQLNTISAHRYSLTSNKQRSINFNTILI